MIFELLTLAVCAFVAIVWCFIAVVGVADSLRTDVPFVPTRDYAIEPALRALALSPGDVLFDLGCGNAKVLAAARQRVPGIRCVGIEKGLLPFLAAKLRAGSTIEIRFQNLVSADISDATHIYLYLSSSVLASIEDKIFSEAPRGTRVVSCSFEFKNHEPIAHVSVDTESRLARELFIYSVL